MSNMNRVYRIGGYDVSKYIKTVAGIKNMQKKPEWGGFPETPRLELELVNTDNTFNPSSSLSIFHGATIEDFDVEVAYLQGSTEIVEWAGSVEEITVDYQNRVAKLTGISPFSKQLDSPALIVTDVGTPAELSQQVFEQFNIECDQASFGYADILQTGLVNVVIDPNLLESTITLMELQKQLASAGYGRIYPYNNKMYYEVFETDRVPSITTEIDDKFIMTHPKETKLEKEPSPYQVEYIDGTSESVSWTEGCSSQTLDFGSNSCVKIQSLTGATQVADQWELISNLKKRVLEFGVTKELGYILDIGSFITINYEKAGIYNEIYEINGIDRTDPGFTLIEEQSI
jgi:hypothetical protein